MTTDVDLAPRGGLTDDSESGSNSEGSTSTEKHAELSLGGLEPDDLTGEFLAAVMDVAEAHGLSIRGISVNRTDE